MSYESERWNRLKTDLMNIKFNEVDQNTLRDRVQYFLYFLHANLIKQIEHLKQKTI